MKKFIALMLAGIMTAGLIAGCGAAPAPVESVKEEVEDVKEEVEETVEDVKEEVEEAAEAGDKKIGFVTFGLGGDFFQMLADEFVKVMSEDGWEASYADGQFNPTVQIEACENYIADKVDVLVCWSVAPEAMDGVIASCQEKGIKFVAFVAPTSSYDAVMISDDATLADYCAKLAAKWIDEKFADEEDHSVPVAVLSCRTADTGVLQANELLKIEEFSKKAKFDIEVECTDETVNDGMAAAENLFVTHPEVQVILTPHSNLATGANNYLTGLSSPITDYTNMGIFAINGDDAMAELIKKSVSDECPMRGMVMTGSVNDTAKEILMVCSGIMDGTLEPGYIREAGTVFVYADTVEEYLSTGTVSSVSNEDFD